MSKIIIGVGGTGAKCVEAITHLAAIGAFGNERILTLIVDPDSANGTLARVQRVGREYARVHHILAANQSGIFGPQFTQTTPDVWSPFSKDDQRSLRDFLEFDILRNSAPDLASLVQVLYSQQELDANLDVGFLGHPSIGAAIFAKALDFGAQPWSTVLQTVEQAVGSGTNVDIMLLGSVFGGTGASGIPTIGRRLRDRLASHATTVRIATTLVLPYFTFAYENKESEALRAEAEHFVANSQSALTYYFKNDLDKTFDAMYAVGDRQPVPMPHASKGGVSQNNAPHHVELIAALAAREFFMEESPAGVRVASRRHADRIAWEDLPVGQDSDFDERFTQFTRMAFAFQAVYRPLLQGKNGSSYSAPWVTGHFLRGRDRISLDDAVLQQDLDALMDYFKSHLYWAASIAHTTREDRPFLNYLSFANEDENKIILKDTFALDAFSSISHTVRDADSNGLHRVWEYVSGTRRTRGEAHVRSLVDALYEGCSDKHVFEL